MRSAFTRGIQSCPIRKQLRIWDRRGDNEGPGPPGSQEVREGLDTAGRFQPPLKRAGDAGGGTGPPAGGERVPTS